AFVPAGLDQTVKNLALSVDSSPQIHPLSANRDEHLVQMPLSMWARPARAEVSRNRRTKPHRPLADRFVADLDAAFCQQILNIPEAQSEPKIQPHSALDDVMRKPVTAVADSAHAPACATTHIPTSA